MKRLIREPLLHFLLIGGLLFAVSAWRGDSESGGEQAKRIDVTPVVIERLRAGYERQFGRAPDEGELRGLVTAHIREEVLYREALAMGLDRDDTIVRRRLAQKMEFLTSDVAGAVLPDDTGLREYFAKNPQRYAKAARVDFRHVYFSKTKRGAGSEAAARGTLESLTKGAGEETMGDAFLHGFEFAEQEANEVSALFGPEFAAKLAELPTGEWRGPVESSYGLHLVFVKSRAETKAAAFDDVRADVLRDFHEERRNAMNREVFDKLKERYAISVDEAALMKAATPNGKSVKQ